MNLFIVNTVFMASSSSEAAASSSCQEQESCTFFIDMEAKEDDNEVDNGVSASERAQQDAESVALRKQGKLSLMDLVMCKGVVYFTVPVIPGETELAFKTSAFATSTSAATPAASTSAPAPASVHLSPSTAPSPLAQPFGAPTHEPAPSPPALKALSPHAWLPPAVDDMAFGAPTQATPDAGSPIVSCSPSPNYRNEPFNLSSLPKIQLEDLPLVQTLIVAPVSLQLGLANPITNLVNYADEDLPQEETVQCLELMHSEPMDVDPMPLSLKLHCLTQGWQIAARFLNGEINSLSLAEIELKKVFHDKYPTEILQMCQCINDLDPKELANQMQDLDIRMTGDGLEEKDNVALASVADVRMAGDGLKEEEDED
ncbi:hypothetical protein BT96DRAFT_998731 [Gymnopus androsaceus JB14]|uniref:Uncharacterized protein n=1 Tax=Gymnopus androsaceus JB14 TaxID=1447944 RepID=A0A6A4H8Z3_9AGAR|nr:hypothetical protein BT96DRAFT_998731 [Gymnopus androsaceus JB14]